MIILNYFKGKYLWDLVDGAEQKEAQPVYTQGHEWREINVDFNKTEMGPNSV
jgi:hypothetical protein